MNASETSGPRYSAGAVFLLAVTFVWLAPCFWTQMELGRGNVAEAYENSELYHFVYPAFHYGFDRMASGEIPLWNPGQLCGVPVQGDPRTSLFQPLNVVFLFFPTPQAMALNAYLCLFTGAIGFSLFARGLGVGYVGAFVGGIAWAFSGASAAGISHPSVASALAWIPFTFWGLLEFARHARCRWAVLTGVFGGLLILSGNLPVVLMASVLILAYALGWCAFWRRSAEASLVRSCIGLLLAGLIAAGVSAILWIPVAARASGLDRPGELLWGLTVDADIPRNLQEWGRQLFDCRPGSLPRLGYVGISTLLLCPAAVTHRRQWPRALFFVVAILCFAGAFVFWDWIASATAPRNGLAFALSFCVSALAAIGIDALLEQKHARGLGLNLAALVLILASGIVLFYVCGAPVRGNILVFAALLAPAVILPLRRVARLCGVFLGFFLFIDLTIASANVYAHPIDDAPDCYAVHEAAVQQLGDAVGDSRLLVSAQDLDTGLPGNLGMLYPVQLAGGSHLPLARNQAVWWRALVQEDSPFLRASGKGITRDAPHPRLLDLMAVRGVLASPDGPLREGVWRHGGPRLHVVQAPGEVRCFLNEDALPRAYWVPEWREMPEAEDALEALCAPDFEPNRECVLDRAPGFDALAPSPDVNRNAAACSIATIAPEHVVVRVDAPAPGVVVLSDTFAPGWSATLDGERVPILCANAVFRGVATPKGSHEIVFRYQPASFMLGAGLSMIVLAFAAGVGLMELAVRRNKGDRHAVERG